MTFQPHGIGLLSGGLDSALAARVVMDAGARVTCLHIFTGFCVTGHNSRVGRKNRPIANRALQVAGELGVPVELIDAADDYLPVVLKPKHGRGANMNPCLDCRVFMLLKAKAYMESVGADFVFTGEVLGQRPMSQVKDKALISERESGLTGKLLRPLSAKLLEPTDVEREGRIDRDKLFDFYGRSRKPQLALAQSYGITTAHSPAGGCCFLTDKAYSGKLRDLIDASEGTPSLEDVFLLGVGRHFRIAAATKLVVGRDEVESKFLEFYHGEHWTATARDHSGPVGVVMGAASEPELRKAAAIVARYGAGKRAAEVEVSWRRGLDRASHCVAPADETVVNEMRVGAR